MHGMVGWQGQERMGGGGKSWVPDLHAKAECVTRQRSREGAREPGGQGRAGLPSMTRSTLPGASWRLSWGSSVVM